MLKRQLLESSSAVITAADLRAMKYCKGGTDRVMKALGKGLSVRRIIKEGVPVREFVGVDNVMIDRLILCAMSRHEREK